MMVLGPESKSLIRSAQQKSPRKWAAGGLVEYDAMAQTFEVPDISSYYPFLFLKDAGHLYICDTGRFYKLMFQGMPHE